MLLVNTVPVTVLFYAGATRSFVNPVAVARMDCKFENLEVPLGVTTPNRISIPSRTDYTELYYNYFRKIIFGRPHITWDSRL